MEKEVIKDGFTGVETVFSTDSSTGNVVVERRADVEPLIKNVERLRDYSGGKGKDFWHLGRIPLAIVESYLAQHKVTFQQFCEDPAHVNRILLDPDYKHFRVFEGNI